MLAADGDACAAFLFAVPDERDEERAIEAVEARKAIQIERDPWTWLAKNIKSILRYSIEDED